jgi:hypothetical protein
MARTSITVQTLAAFGGKVEDVTMTAGDATNDMSFAHPGGQGCFLTIDNGDASPQVTTINAVATQKTFNMATNITVTTAAGARSYVAIPPTGFTQSDGTVQIDMTSDTSLTLAVLSITPSP